MQNNTFIATVYYLESLNEMKMNHVNYKVEALSISNARKKIEDYFKKIGDEKSLVKVSICRFDYMETI